MSPRHIVALPACHVPIMTCVTLIPDEPSARCFIKLPHLNNARVGESPFSVKGLWHVQMALPQVLQSLKRGYIFEEPCSKLQGIFEM